MSPTEAQDPDRVELRGVPDRLLVAGEVAELLAVPESWVRDATRAGRLPHVRLGRYVRYERDAVVAWVHHRRAGPRGKGRAGQRSGLPFDPGGDEIR